nr:hypothetical protein [Tanacetum cinerariifolium]
MATTIEQQVTLDEALVPSTQRIPGESFDELPFEEEILDFLRFLGHSAQIRTLTDRSGTPRLTKNTTLMLLEKQHLSLRPVPEGKRSGSDSSITPPTAIASPRPTITATPKLTASAKGKQPAKATKAKSLFALSELTASAKGKQPAKATKAKSLFALSEVAMNEAEQLKLALKRSWQQMHISQPAGSGTYEGTGSKPGVPDDREDNEGDEKDESDEGEKDDADDKDGDERDDDDDDDDDEEEIAKIDEQDDTERDSEDDGNNEEDQGFKDGEEERLNDEEEADELYRDQESSSVSSQFVTSMLNPTSEAGVESIFATASTSVAPLPTPKPTMTPYIIATITTARQAPIPPTLIPNKQTHLLKPSLTFRALVEAYEADKIILDTYGETVTLKRRRDDESDKDEGPFAGSDRGSKRQREGKEPESASALLQTATRSAGRSTTGSKSRQASASESAFAKEPVQTTSQIEELSHLVFETGAEDQPIVQSSQHPKLFSQPKKPPTLDHTPLDFSNFIMNRLRVDTLTPELLAGPTYELMKGSCKSRTELEYHLEEVYKATTDQLDWVNPKGQHYLHNLLQPLPLIPNNRGRRVIPFAHFINNDLEYLRGGSSSRKYTTSVKKMKAADYGHIKWIEDLVPCTMWIHEPINYDKHALWGVSHWGQKRQQFYGFVVNRESALDVYSKRRIIAITDLKIVEWHSYKHLDWITRHVEDLQLGVKSYLKRLNLTKPDTDRSDLKQRKAYTAYSNPRGFIYQNKDKKNRLMRIDELHKFSDRTLNDVRNALDDRIREVLLMLETLSRRFFLKLNLSDHRRQRYLIPTESQIHNRMLIPDYQDIIFQDFCYSNGFECYQVIKIGRYEHEELELFEALNHKSVIVNEGSHRVVMFKKETPRGYSRPFTRFSLPCDVDGQDYGKYERKMVKEVHVEIHGFTFLVDFVVIGYANEGEPSVLFGRDFLVTSKSRVDFGISEMCIDLTMLEEIKKIDVMLDALVENLEEVGSFNGDLVKMGKASQNKNHKVNKLAPPPQIKIEEIPPISTIAPPSPIYHPLTQKQKRKVKEVLDLLMERARFNNDDYRKEVKMRIVEHGLPRKMCDPGNFVLSVKVNGTIEMNALVDTRASVSVLPYCLFMNLGLGDPKTYNFNLTMADNTQAKAIGEVKNVRFQIGAVIDMGRSTLCIYDGVIRHSYFPKPRPKAYLEILHKKKKMIG